VTAIGAPALRIGEKLGGIIEAGSLAGTFEVVRDNSHVFNFIPEYSGTDVSLTVVAAASLLDAVNSTGSRAAAGAAGVLDRLLAGALPSDADMDNVIAALGKLPDARTVSDAVSQTAPLLAANQSLAIASVMHGIDRIVVSRQELARGRSSGDAFWGDRNFWLKPFGSRADQGDRNGVSGFNADSYGIILGAEVEPSARDRIGLAAAYVRSDVDGNSQAASQSSRVRSYQVTVYGTHRIGDATDLDFRADVGRHDTDAERAIPFMGRVARADYHNWSAHLGAAVSRLLSLDPRTAFTPSLRADYSIIADDSYRETGAGSLNLDVNTGTARELILGVDGKLTHALSDNASISANLGVGYDVLDKTGSVTSTFAGVPGSGFQTRGIDPKPWIARGGFGFTSRASDTIEFSARYDFELRKGFDNQTVSIMLRGTF
jgi:outer membrane autotransporter protein